MGVQKLSIQLDGISLLERALQAAANFTCVVVAGPALAEQIAPGPRLRVVINPAPERGMAHSLALADAAVPDRAAALVVLLADTPFVDAALIRAVLEARGDADVAFPVRDGVPGHPVVFGPRPRQEIAGLPEGDTLRRLRDDPRWRRVELPIGDDRPFLDVDTPADLERLAGRPPDGTSGTFAES